MSWQRLDKPWHDTNVVYCDVCGNLVIDRAWVFTTPDGRELRACREDDERLHAVLGEYAQRIEDARAAFETRSTEAQGGS